MGFLISLVVIVYLSKQQKLNPYDAFLGIPVLGLFMLAGGRIPSTLNYIIKNFSDVIKNPGDLWKFILSGGGEFFGALIGLLLWVFLYLKPMFKKNALKFADITLGTLPLGHAIARIGCFMAGCCWGRPTDLPWGVHIPHLARNPHPMSNNAIHPTQIYEFFLNVFNFIFLMVVLRKKKYGGQIVSLFCINYGIIRFIMEYLRADVRYILKGKTPLLSLTLYQLTAAILICVGIILHKVLSKKNIKSDE